jgi:hypothetical protein
MAAVMRVTKSLPPCIYFLGVRNVLRRKDQFDSDQRRRLCQRRESGHRRKSELGQSATVHCRRPINQDFIDLFGHQGTVLVPRL